MMMRVRRHARTHQNNAIRPNRPADAPPAANAGDERVITSNLRQPKAKMKKSVSVEFHHVVLTKDRALKALL